MPQSEESPQTIAGLLTELVAQMKFKNELLVYTILGMIPPARRRALMEAYGISFTPASGLTPRARRCREKFLARQATGEAA